MNPLLTNRSRLALLVAIIAAVIAMAISFQTPVSAQPAQAPSLTLTPWARGVALALANEDGDATPSRVEFVLATPAQIARVGGETSTDSTTKLCAIVLRGNFTMYSAYTPAGVKPFHADWIMVVVREDTHEVMGTTASTGEPDLTSLDTLTPVTL